MIVVHQSETEPGTPVALSYLWATVRTVKIIFGWS